MGNCWRKKEFVEQQVKELNLCDTVFLLGRYPLEDMPDLFIHADVMLVSLKDQNIFSLTIPSKIQSYMAFGKPIISMINGIGNEIIKEANCGFTANAGDFESLANNVKRLSRMDKNMLYEKGRAGKEYYQLSFAKKKIIDNLIGVFQSE